jgi:histidine ammonia-lyase
MRPIHSISSEPLTLDVLEKQLTKGGSLQLSDRAIHNIEKCRKYLDEKLASSNAPIYGINTGFGSLYNRNIPKDQLEKLQENLVMSHACGTGGDVPQEIIRLMLFLKVQSLSYGYSGVHVATVQRLIDLFNADALPRIFEMGSLGASGDLAPLAHLTLPLIGKGEVWLEGKLISAEQLLIKFGWNALHLKAKEGLALLNGTQFMSAYACWCIVHAHRLIQLANTIGALSLDAFDGRIEPFDALVHQIRPHKGQVAVASTIRNLLSGSQLQAQSKKHVQDPYSFRCIPQVHGASLEAIEYFTEITLTEINGVTDNPNIFPDEDKIISAGNFHGQPLALGLDFLAIALAETDLSIDLRFKGITQLLGGQSWNTLWNDDTSIHSCLFGQPKQATVHTRFG